MLAGGEDPFSIDGRRVVVVGGTAGIGLAVAGYLAGAGAEVVITGRRDGSEAARRTSTTFVPMDVTDDHSVTGAFALIEAHAESSEHREGPAIDGLILNAGVDLAHGEIGALDLATFEQVLAVNTIGVARAMAGGVKLMGLGGSVVVTSSPAGSTTTPGMAAYSASKAAVDMLVRTWALELGPKQIRVNAVAPGIVESEMASESAPELELIRRMTANGVYRKADELGPVFQFLVSAASSTLTGSLVGAHDGISVGYSHEVLNHLAADLPSSGEGAQS